MPRKDIINEDESKPEDKIQVATEQQILFWRLDTIIAQNDEILSLLKKE
jgi:hypothetical protein